MVRACISAGELECALETVERSKSRQLVELLANAELYPKGAPAQLTQELNQLRRRISAAQQFLAEVAGEEKAAGTSGNLTTEYIQQQRQILEESQPQLDKLLNQIKEFDPQFALTQRVEPITFKEIRPLIDSETAILEWHIGTQGFQTFIITGNTLEVVQFAGEELQQLQAWKDTYLGDYNPPRNEDESEKDWKNRKKKRLDDWINQLEPRLSQLASILHLDRIIAKIPPTCSRLILIPHRYLHLFPLHALPVSPTCRGNAQPATNLETGVTNTQGEAFAATNSGGETEVTSANASPLQGYCLLDEFPAGVRYAPSCQLLQLVRNRKRSAGVPRFLFAIQNPTKNLKYAEREVEVIKRDFDPHTRILTGEQATKTELQKNLDILRRTDTAHFSCHGKFEVGFPLSSSLILADSLLPTGGEAEPPAEHSQAEPGNEEKVEEGDKRYLTLRDGRKVNPERCLTLQDIFASLELPQCRLVTLSACETGLTGAAQGIDEYIGLPSGFLYAGSLSVVSSLWRVDDFATAVLMIKFYECLRGGDSGESGVPVALNTAQTWLRNVTKEDFLNWVTGLGLPKRYNEEAQLWVDCSPDDKPFHKPQYWAAFGAIGH
ncbi:CHAT domain-containing protein [Kamptonema formosum]|uniref:CHAT domain-containing protein n=1 Tax=Kamptonema formosum TaxID=331992 RepID=UPI00350EF5BE